MKESKNQTIQTRRTRLVGMTGKEMIQDAKWDSKRFTLRDVVSVVGISLILTVVLQNLVWLACQMAKVS